MADLNLLSDLYRTYNNGELIQKYFEERDSITPEALQAFKIEFEKRNLNLSGLEETHQLQLQLKDEFAAYKKSKTQKQLLIIINQIINDKKEQKSNQEIITRLENNGVPKKIAPLLIKEAKEKCSSIIEDVYTQLFWGIASSIAGTVIFLASAKLSKGTMIVVPLGLIVFGVFKLGGGISGLSTRKQLKPVLDLFKASESIE